MRDINVLSSACGAFFMPGFFHCLKANDERNIRIIGCDIDEGLSMKFLVDKYYRVPKYTAPDYIDCLLDICRKEKIDIFFPHISMELPYILKHKQEFEKLGVKVAITTEESLMIANDKYKLYEFMQEKKIETPKYFLVNNSTTLRKRISELGFPQQPVCVKMTTNSGSRGVRIIRPQLSKSEAFLSDKPSYLNVSLDEMCEILDGCSPMPTIIAMEYFSGIEYTVDLLADKGETLYIAGRRNTSSYMSIAQSSEVDKIDVAYDICMEIVRELNLDGNIGFDFMLDQDGKPWLTDLNPRITATIILYAGAGLNLPYLRIKQLLKEDLPTINVDYTTKLIRKYQDILYNQEGLIRL